MVFFESEFVYFRTVDILFWTHRLEMWVVNLRVTNRNQFSLSPFFSFPFWSAGHN